MFVCRRCMTIICDSIIKISNDLIIVEKVKTLNVKEIQFNLLKCNNCDSNLGFFKNARSTTYNINALRVIKIFLKH